jgi:hypothetical protein
MGILRFMLQLPSVDVATFFVDELSAIFAVPFFGICPAFPTFFVTLRLSAFLGQHVPIPDETLVFIP